MTLSFLHDDRVERGVVEGDKTAFTAVDGDRLRGRFPHLESGSRRCFCNGILSRIECDACLVQRNLAVRVRVQRSKVIRRRSVGNISRSAVRYMELSACNGRAADAVQLVNAQGRCPVVPKYDTPDFARPQTDRLNAVRLIFRQIVGGGNERFRNPVRSRFDPFGDCSVLAGGPCGCVGVIHTLHGEYRAGDDCPVAASRSNRNRLASQHKSPKRFRSGLLLLYGFFMSSDATMLLHQSLLLLLGQTDLRLPIQELQSKKRRL